LKNMPSLEMPYSRCSRCRCSSSSSSSNRGGTRPWLPFQHVD
jgi:hypothetical protein